MYSAAADSSIQRGKGISPDVLLAAARRLDNLVALASVTKDPVEIRDLIAQGREIMSTMQAILQEKGVRTPEQRDALGIFRRAEDYFRKSMLKQ